MFGEPVTLERDGWELFPPLDRELIDQLLVIAEDFARYTRTDPSVGGTAWDLERGLRNIWRTEDPAVRRSFEARITEVLKPTMERLFPGYRAIAFGMTTKLAGVPHDPLPYHRDQALLDERGGQAALHLWIPLVDISAENGGLIVVTGTHLTAPPIRPLGVAERDPLAHCSVDELPPNAVLPEMAAGTVLAFDNRTTHASTVNRSDRDRPAIMVCLLPDGSRMIEWVPRDDHIELWEVRDSDSSYAGRATARIRLLEKVPWPGRSAPAAMQSDSAAPPPPPPATDLCDSMAELLQRQVAGWTLTGARASRDQLVLDWEHESSGALQVLFERLAPGQPCYKRVRELGLSYNPPRNGSGKLDASAVALLGSLASLAERSVERLRAMMEQAAS